MTNEEKIRKMNRTVSERINDVALRLGVPYHLVKMIVYSSYGAYGASSVSSEELLSYLEKIL